MSYLIVDGQGVAVSLTTVLPSSLPNGYTTHPLSDSDYTALTSGASLWQNGQLVANPVYAATQVTTTNAADLLAKARVALTTNATFLGTVAGRRTAIASGKTTATTGTTATVGSIAVAQTQIRSLWTVLVQVATALDDLNNDAESLTKQNDAVIRLLAGLVMGASDLLQDTTGT